MLTHFAVRTAIRRNTKQSSEDCKHYFICFLNRGNYKEITKRNKLKDSGWGGVGRGEGQSHNAQAIPSGWGLRVTNQTREKYSSAVSQTEKQKTNNLKGGHGHSRSSCNPPVKPACWSSSLKCLYTNACSTGNKQEELEICVQSQGHDLIAITETWWDSSHDWNAVIDGYTLFRKDRPTTRGGGVALHVREKLEYI